MLLCVWLDVWVAVTVDTTVYVVSSDLCKRSTCFRVYVGKCLLSYNAVVYFPFDIYMLLTDILLSHFLCDHNSFFFRLVRL